MKYGLLTYPATTNIGDDIQSYAALRFLPSVDYVLDRENLDGFVPDDEHDAPVSAIMNAWYLEDKRHWPPSRFINPLFVSAHFWMTDPETIWYGHLTGPGGDYLRHYAPIGARDESTRAYLEDVGVDAYLSGCMTLTLELPERGEQTDEVILVDLEEELAGALKKRYRTAHWVETSHEANPETFHMLSMKERMEGVERRLKRYQGASCVITERLHCALPCLALGTPVLLIYRPQDLDRMGSFLPLLHAATPEELLAGQVDFDVLDPPENPTTYLRYRYDLERRCREFVAACERGECPPPISFSRLRLACWHAWYLHRPRVVVRSWLHHTGLEGPLRSLKRSVLGCLRVGSTAPRAWVSGFHGR